jgi:hypothetical protein
MATKSKSAHWQAAFRRRMREAGLKALTLWLPKEGIDRLARYSEKERGEVVTRALMLLESQGGLASNDATITDKLTGESRDFEPGEADRDTLTVAELSTITSNSTGKLTGDDTILTGESTGELTGDESPGPPAIITGEFIGEAASEATSITGEPTDKSTGEVVVTVTEIPPLPVAEPPAGLPPKRVAALSRRAKRLSAQGVSWKEIAHRFNAEGIPTLSGTGLWHGSTVKHMIEKQGRGEAD